MSSTTSKPTKAATLAQVQALIAGTKKYFPNGSFTLGNVAYTTATLIQAFQDLVNALVALNAAKASVKDALKTVSDTTAKVGPVIRDYKRFVLAAFGDATQQLGDFGMQPPKARKPLDSEQRAAVTAKVRATRAARGTTSKKQKLAVKGDVTGVDITPITAAGPKPTPTAQPAPTASSAPTTGTATK